MKNEPKGYGVKATMSGNPKASDSTGERSSGLIKGMVANAKENKMGADSKFDGGRCGGVCYTHTRDAYK